MNFVLNNNLYNQNYLYIMDSVSNNVLENGTFHRIIYSNSHMTLNSLIFKITFTNIEIIKTFNKYKIIYTDNSNLNTFVYIEELENSLLNKFILQGTALSSIMDSIKTDNLKLYSSKHLESFYPNLTVYLKISGFWINNNSYGITYKFLH
jgi:hypothetical protein